jgi:hypothetical protein
MVWAPKLSQSFSANPHPEETLFHNELARYNQVKRGENGLIPRREMRTIRNGVGPGPRK